MSQVTIASVQSEIMSLPNRPPFMTGAALAKFYDTRTDRITEAVRRNPDRFPEDFAFRLTKDEAEVLITQNALSRDTKHLPLVFTRAGAHALSGVLKTKVAAERSVMIYRAFAALEELTEALRSETEVETDIDPDAVLIGKDELILLQKARIEQLERKAGVNRKPRRVARPMTSAESGEMLRLHSQGWSISKIAKHLDRNPSIVWTVVHSQVVEAGNA